MLAICGWLAGQVEERLLERLLGRFRALKRCMPGVGSERALAHVLASICTPNRLEVVTETMRVAAGLGTHQSDRRQRVAAEPEG